MSCLHCRVLLVSNDPEVNGIVHDVIRRDRHFNLVAECHQGLEGTRLLSLRHPELVLLNSPLPDKSAETFIKKARTLLPSARIILVSGRSEMHGFAMAHRKGADGYISSRLLGRELPLVLARYHELLPEWGRRFSPWKEQYGMA